jgi:hypothetical protein
MLIINLLKEILSKILSNILTREVFMKRYTLLFVCFLFLVSALSLENAKANEPVLSSTRWETDIRIGDRDSVNAVAFDVDYSTGNLFVALKNTENGTDYWSVYMSSDTGRTWTEKTGGLVGPDIAAVDAAVFKDHFYVVYTTWTTVLIRRFGTDDGSWDGTYGTDTVITGGMGIKEIALASTQDFSPPTRLYCFIIRNAGYLNYLYSSEDVGTWDILPLSIDNADRGLDACCNEGYSSEYVWCSYMSTNDRAFVGSVGATFTSYGPLNADPASGMNITSIGAYNNTIMVLYPHVGGEFAFSVRSSASYDGGNIWHDEGPILGPTGTTWGASDITARKGDGLATVSTTVNFGAYRYRDYPMGDWSDTVHFTEHLVKAPLKPSIERIATNSYGIVYIDQSTMGAWFDISQWPVSGIEEPTTGENEVSIFDAKPSVFTSRTSIEYILPTQQNISLDIYDLLGNHVIKLVSGEAPAGTHSVNWDGKDALEDPVASGVYVCVLKSKENSTASTKITLIK